MLDDTSRKVLRILFNLYRGDIFYLDIELISRYSNRSEERVKAAVKKLIELEYLGWHETRNRYKIDHVKFVSDFG